MGNEKKNAKEKGIEERNRLCEGKSEERIGENGGSYASDLQQESPGSRVTEQDFIYGTEARTENGKKHTIEDYYALPDDLRVELIDGEFFIMNAPTSFHQLAAGEVYRQIQNFIRENKGKCMAFISPVDVRLDCDDYTMVQPDVIIVCDREKIERWGIMGAPDFVLEVLSPSTSRKDSVLKFKKYINAGVKEYWMIDPDAMKLIVINLTEHSEQTPEIYGLTGKVPINLYEGRLQIDLDIVGELIREFS